MFYSISLKLEGKVKTFFLVTRYNLVSLCILLFLQKICIERELFFHGFGKSCKNSYKQQLICWILNFWFTLILEIYENIYTQIIINPHYLENFNYHCLKSRVRSHLYLLYWIFTTFYKILVFELIFFTYFL